MASDVPGAAAPGRAPPRYPDEGPRPLRLAFPCTGPDAEAARACEQRVFARRFGNTPEQLELEYGPFEDGTSFGAVLLPDGRAVGAVRLLRGGPAGLKTMQDAARPPWCLTLEGTRRAAALDWATTWDVGTFGVDADTYGTGSHSVTRALLCLMFGAFRDNGVESFLALMDRQAARAFASVGLRMTDLPGARPAPYLGSAASVPAYASLTDLHRRQAADLPDVHDQVFHGLGLQGLDPGTASPGCFARQRIGVGP